MAGRSVCWNFFETLEGAIPLPGLEIRLRNRPAAVWVPGWSVQQDGYLDQRMAPVDAHLSRGAVGLGSAPGPCSTWIVFEFAAGIRARLLYFEADGLSGRSEAE